MLITVTTTSQTLDNILTSIQVWNMDKTKFSTSQSVPYYDIMIQNLWINDIYIDFGTLSTITWWVRIKTDEIFTFTWIVLSNINLIADIWNNNNIRLISN